MEKTLRIICLWICFHSCLLDYADVEVQAVPLEYFDNHDQLSYDMDTEQSKVKYDPRILSEQDDNDVWAHERAASCSSGTTKYTHGQKIPRDDPCEVCLCVDGEIFCWWKHCDAAPINSKLTIQSDKRTMAEKEMFFDRTQKTTSNLTTTATTTSTTTTSRPVNKKEFYKKQYPITRISKKMHKMYDGYHQQNQQQQQQQHQQKQKKTEHNSPSNKILNFPENLPSVLYYDYKTEEHQHHQHQHQHLKHRYPLKQFKKHEYSSDSHQSGVAGGGGDSSRRQQKEHNVGNMLPSGELSANRTLPGDNSNIDTAAQLLLFNGASSTYARNTVEGDNEDDDGDDIGNSNGDQRGNRIRSHSDKLKSMKTSNGKISLQSTQSASSSPSPPPFSIDDKDIRNIKNVFPESFLNDKIHDEYSNNANINGADKKLLTRRPVAFADSENSLNQMDMLKDANMNRVNGDDGNQMISVNNYHHHRGTGVDIVDGKVAAVAELFRSTFNDFSSEFNGSSSKLNLILSESERQQQERHEHQQVEPIILEANSILDYRANISNNTSSAGTTSTTNNSSHREADFTNSTTTAGGTYINNSSAELVEITTTIAAAAAETPPTTIRTDNTEKECIVMDTSYKIGDILPQETGNCLQCICIDGTMKDDTPRVTCSPHNCPPLILPDLLDATGY